MPLLDFIWVVSVFFLLVAWILVIVGVVADVFRSKDLSGLAKAGWLLLIIVIPWLGVIAYLIARGDGLSYRYLEALGRTERGRTADPRQGTPLGVSWRSTSYSRQTGMAGALDFDLQSARILR